MTNRETAQAARELLEDHARTFSGISMSLFRIAGDIAGRGYAEADDLISVRCIRDQLKDEAKDVGDLLEKIMEAYGITEYDMSDKGMDGAFELAFARADLAREE